MESQVKERVKKVLEVYGSNTTQFAKLNNLNQKTVYNQVYTTTQLSASIILLLLDTYSEISAEWLLRGKGSMYNDNAPNSELDAAAHSMHDKIIALEAENRVLREIVNLRKKSSTISEVEIA